MSQASQATVDVLIVSYNTRVELEQTLRTLLAHPPVAPLRMRVHVLDNCSSDGSAELVAEDFPSVELVRSECNLGFGRAMNRLAGGCDGEYLMLLNSDVIVNDDICTPLVAALQGDQRAVVASPRLLSLDGYPQLSANRLPTLRSELALQLKGTRLGRACRPVFDAAAIVDADRQLNPTLGLSGSWHSQSIWATCWLLRRADVPGGALFDERFPLYDEDLDFCLRMRQQQRTLLYVPTVELVHLGGASSTQAQKSAAMLTGRRRYYRYHGGRVREWLFSYGVMRVVPWLVARVAAIPRPGSLRGGDG